MLHIKIVRKGFKYKGYITVLFEGYKKVNVFQSSHKVFL